MSEPRGIPYTLTEARLLLDSNHAMDPYHRDLMRWLIDQLECWAKPVEGDLVCSRCGKPWPVGGGRCECAKGIKEKHLQSEPLVKMQTCLVGPAEMEALSSSMFDDPGFTPKRVEVTENPELDKACEATLAALDKTFFQEATPEQVADNPAYGFGYWINHDTKIDKEELVKRIRQARKDLVIVPPLEDPDEASESIEVPVV